jgi:hypothetical protein
MSTARRQRGRTRAGLTSKEQFTRFIMHLRDKYQHAGRGEITRTDKDFINSH